MMARFDFSDNVRKIFLAGVGAVATTAEKGQDLVNDLVQKGELTVDQGKLLNTELSHKIKKTSNKAAEKICDAAFDYADRMKLMTSDERREFVQHINDLAKKMDNSDASEEDSQSTQE